MIPQEVKDKIANVIEARITLRDEKEPLSLPQKARQRFFMMEGAEITLSCLPVSLEEEVKSGWISAEDRLPDYATHVWVSYEVFGEPIVHSVPCYIGPLGGWVEAGSLKSIHPTHWRPFALPAPPTS